MGASLRRICSTLVYAESEALSLPVYEAISRLHRDHREGEDVGTRTSYLDVDNTNSACLFSKLFSSHADGWYSGPLPLFFFRATGRFVVVAGL